MAEGDDVIAARAALLDFYGDYSVSFSSQFVASIFGLITASALINSVLASIRTQFAVSSRFDLFSAVVIGFSLIVFFGFASAAVYTYRRFKFYADLASKLVRVPNCLRYAAQMNKVKVDINVQNKEKDILKVEEDFCRLNQSLPEDYRKQIQERQKITVSFPQYEMASESSQNKILAKVILNSRLFPLVMGLGMTSLFFVTYYPILASFVSLIIPK